MALVITDTNISDILTNNKVTIIDFWAPWCGPCRMVGPIIEELATDNPNVAIGKLNVDENALTANKYGIRGIPAIFFYKNGEIIERMVGVSSKDKLQSKINELVG